MAGLSSGRGGNPTRIIGGNGNIANVNGSNELETTGGGASSSSGVVQTAAPAPAANGSAQSIGLDEYKRAMMIAELSGATRWGQGFFTTGALVTRAPVGGDADTEAPAFLIRNPNASGKIVKFGRWKFFNATVSGSIYIGPTVTSDGTALTVVGARQTGQNANVALCFRQPQTSAFGSKIADFQGTGSGTVVTDIDFEQGLWLDANQSLLITGGGVINAGVYDFTTGSNMTVNASFIEA